MAETAMSLFEHSGFVDGIVHDLTAKGLLEKDIRISGEPIGTAAV